MNKTLRQRAILELLKQGQVADQEKLQRALRKRGIKVGQPHFPATSVTWGSVKRLMDTRCPPGMAPWLPLCHRSHVSSGVCA